MTATPPQFERYSRQMRFAGIGPEGQQRLAASRVFLCGCGALGTALAESLVRAGVGFLRIVDRDFVELSNLQRQVLFDERDVAEQLPKSVAAANKLATINSQVELEPLVADVTHRNIRELIAGVDLILDGTDNFETRFLLNDVALETGTPWIYGGCTGSHGQTLTIIPGETVCLRCVIDGPPPPGSTETCDTAGVIGPAIQAVTALQTVAALQLLTGQRTLIRPQLTMLDVWTGEYRQLDFRNFPEASRCPACRLGERRWLSGQDAAGTTVLCGRNAVQITPANAAGLDLARVAESLRASGTVTTNPFLVRVTLNQPAVQVTVFRDGRAIVQGTDDPALARTLYARLLGG